MDVSGDSQTFVTLRSEDLGAKCGNFFLDDETLRELNSSRSFNQDSDLARAIFPLEGSYLGKVGNFSEAYSRYVSMKWPGTREYSFN